ncbi:MAG: hypothetical protein H8E74_01470 [Gammaproteobacteria bacterium]|nr:hypothetical protein [Gammaproteobacteria bacterium]
MAALFEYALDTETTGLSPAQGHRVIEIACIELKDRERTGRFFHYYLNPGRDIDKAASKVHGITLAVRKNRVPAQMPSATAGNKSRVSMNKFGVSNPSNAIKTMRPIMNNPESTRLVPRSAVGVGQTSFRYGAMK